MLYREDENKLKHNNNKKRAVLLIGLPALSLQQPKGFFLGFSAKESFKDEPVARFACDVVSCDAEDIRRMLHSSCSDLPWAGMVSEREIACDVFESESYI